MKVFHKVFKEGIVIKFDGKYVTVKFDMGEKKFMYPMAFIGGFLEVKKFDKSAENIM